MTKDIIIKSNNLLLFSPDVLKVEYVMGLNYSHYIVAYKNGKTFYIKGYESEEKAIEKLNSVNEAIKNGETYLEI